MIFLCFNTGPRFPETADPWRPAHSIKAASCKSEIRSRFIYYPLILLYIGLSRFTSTVTSGNPLPNESSAQFQLEIESDLHSTEKLRRGAEPTSPCTHYLGCRRNWDNEQTSQSASTDPAPPALGSSPCELTIHILEYPKQSSLKDMQARKNRYW